MLVTAGGTREPLDAVRFLGNRSSGRMGVALAEEARRRGADVVLLAANLAVPAPHGVETIPTPTAESMLDAALALADVDIALLAAAVADYRPSEAIDVASARRATSRGRSSSSRPSTSPAASARRSAPDQLLVTFGADLGEEGLERKRAMLETKNADLVVFNDVSRSDIAFDAADNEVVLVTRAGDRTVPKAAKAAIAAAILDEVGARSVSDERGVRPLPGRTQRLKEGHGRPGHRAAREGEALEPDKASIREALGIAYFRLRRWDEAEAEFRAVLDLSPTDDYAHYALGRTLEKQGREAEANGHFKLASSMNPANESYASRIRELE